MQQNAVSDQDLHCFLSEYSMNFLIKKKNILPNNPYNRNGLVQLIKVGNFIRLKWVKQNNKQFMRFWYLSHMPTAKALSQLDMKK